jgi:hypothetical protein
MRSGNRRISSGRRINSRNQNMMGTRGTNGLAVGSTVTGGTNQTNNPVIRDFRAPTSPRYFRPDGSIVRVGDPLHEHQDRTIMTQHSSNMDNAVVVTTTPPRGGAIVSTNRPTRRRSTATQMAMNRARNRRPNSGRNQTRTERERASVNRNVSMQTNTNMNRTSTNMNRTSTNMNRTTNRPARTQTRTTMRQPTMRRGGRSGGGGY